MNSHLVDEKGKIRNFQQFKRKVIATDTKYNKNHLQAEYQTAKRSAKMAIKWKDFEKNKRLFPNLKYMTTNDDKVRKDHAPLHGIIRAVNDPFWNTYYPPNGWRCRCYVKQTTEPVNDKQPKELPTKGFTHNAGKSNQIYNPKEHPYFNIPKKDSKDVKIAFENFKQLKSYGKPKKTFKNGAKVYIHPFADPEDIFGNYRAAIKLANAGITVKIRPHSYLDDVKNPEYEIFNKMSDRAEPIKARGIKSIINEKVNKQKAKIVVLDFTYKFDKKITRFDLAKALKGAVVKNTKLEGVVLIFNKEVISLSRKEFLDNSFWEKVIKKATN